MRDGQGVLFSPEGVVRCPPHYSSRVIVHRKAGSFILGDRADKMIGLDNGRGISCEILMLANQNN